jgi:hypothetical protein
MSFFEPTELTLRVSPESTPKGLPGFIPNDKLASESISGPSIGIDDSGACTAPGALRPKLSEYADGGIGWKTRKPPG